MKKKVKVLLVTPYFLPHSGGLEIYAFNIARGLMETHGYEVVVVTSNPDEKKQVIDNYCGIKVYRLPIMLRVANTPINPLWYILLKRIIRAEKPDIINSHQPVPFIGDLVASLIGNIPFVLTYHAGSMKKNKLLPDIIISLYEILILPHTAKKATRIICASNVVKNTILRKYALKSIVIHPGVDISLFTADPTIKKDENTILFVCRYKNMHRMKGLYYLLEAIEALPDVKLRIVGEKDDFIDERIVSVGLKQGKELVEEMQKARLLVLPSTGQQEGFPMVLIEAMACQTPVIGSDRGGIPEVIADGIDGFIVPAKDSNALRLAIVKILVDKELTIFMGQRGKEKVKKQLSWDTRVILTKEVFESCLK